MASTCPHLAAARAPPAGQHVYKDECSQCFTSWDDVEHGGVSVCLTCFNSGCGTVHARTHADRTGHHVVATFTRTPKARREDGTPPPAKMTKLAIAAESDKDKYDVHVAVSCLACSVHVDAATADSHIASVLAALERASSASLQNEVKAWELELEACEHTVCLAQTAAKQLDAHTAHCGMCDLKENLWLCLACGHLGCGRAQFGGLPGNGHALAHAKSCPDASHAVAVKLGTITPEGSADVYCYACDDERLDPYLATHMAHFGVNLATVTKTEKSLVEMQIEQNLKFEFEMTSADGQALEPVHGPYLRGLKNLGNSCYLASVVQCLLRIPEFRARYAASDAVETHLLTCTARSHAECWECQWHKLAAAIAHGGHAHEHARPDRGNGAVAPGMFKHVVAAGHKEFGSMKQQDASEFLQHLLKQVQQHERRTGRDPAKALEAVQVQTLQCTSCGGVKVAEANMLGTLNLMVPDDALQHELAREKAAEAAKAREETDAASGVPAATAVKGAAEAPADHVTVDAVTCLQSAMREHVEFDCPRCAKRCAAVKATGLKTFPKFLAVVAQRFTYDNWVPKKSNVHIAWPAELDLGFMKLDVPPAEQQLKDAPAAPAQDSEELLTLVSFGIPRGKAKRALRLTGGKDLEAAMNWAMDHPEDVSEADEDAAASGGSAPAQQPAVDEGAVMMLGDMGFTPAQARYALRETGGDVERAVEWLFSHPEATGEEPAAADNAAAPAAAGGERLDSDTHAKYALEGFINHKGPSMLCGHYIAHVRDDKGTGKWVMLNDDRVVAQPNAKGLLEEAYVYLLRRLGQ